MQTIQRQVEIDRTVINDEIEKALSKYGEPIRWAVVKADDKKFTVEAVFIN